MKVACVGTGRMGRRHIQAVQAMGLEIAAVCDPQPAALELAFKDNGIAPSKHFTNYGQMLKAIRPDCVIVATTAPAHCEYTCMAAEHGIKYILCEKPMAVSLAECDRMIVACRQAGALLAINHQMRFMEQYMAPKRLMASGEFGGLGSITVVSGNFGLAMNGTHYFEMFRYMTDEAPQEAVAWLSTTDVPNPRGDQFKDRAGAVRLSTASGKRFYLEASDDQGHGVQVIYAGKYGQIVVDELAGQMRWMAREGQYRGLPTTRYGMPRVEQTSSIAPADVVGPSKAVLKALLEKGPYPTGEEGRMAVAALVAAYVSNENHHAVVRIDGKLPYERVFPWA